MKIFTGLCIAFALLSSSAFGQVSQAQIAMGGSQADDGYGIVQTTDGGYAVAGITGSFGAGTNNVYVMRFNSNGLLMWAKAIGGTGIDQGYSICQSRDGGFAVTGYTNSFAKGIEDVYVIKLDASGNIKWTESIGGASAEQGKCIIQTKDGGYAIGGYTLSFGAGAGDFYIIKLDSNGAGQWTKTIGGGGDEEAYTLIQTADGGYAMAGYTLSFGAGNSDVYVVKLDGLGNLQWTRTVGGPLGDAGFGICQTSDKGYAVTGYEAESTFGAGSDDVYLIKLDSTGALKWTKTIGGSGNDQGQAIIQTKDGGLAIAGFTASFGAGAFDIYLIKTDASGTLQWSKTCGGASNDVGSSLVQTSDGGFAVAGYTTSYGAGSDDVYVVKFDSAGNTCLASEGVVASIVGTGGTASTGGTEAAGGKVNYTDSGRVVDISTGFDSICRKKKTTGIYNIAAGLNQIKLYPNPSSNLLNVDFGNQPELLNTKVTVEILDITGRVLKSDELQMSSDIYSINISNLNTGLYFMKVSSGTSSEVKKFMKE